MLILVQLENIHLTIYRPEDGYLKNEVFTIINLQQSHQLTPSNSKLSTFVLQGAVLQDYIITTDVSVVGLYRRVVKIIP